MSSYWVKQERGNTERKKGLNEAQVRTTVFELRRERAAVKPALKYAAAAHAINSRHHQRDKEQRNVTVPTPSRRSDRGRLIERNASPRIEHRDYETTEQ